MGVAAGFTSRDGQIEKTLLDDKSAAQADRRGALDKERMRLIAEAQPSCDPETLRERMPEALAFVREWVHRADGDELQLLLQALRVSIKAAREKAEIRVEVPLIEGVEGRNYSTIEQTSAWTFSNHKPEPASVPFRRTFVRTARPGGRVE